MEAMPALTNIDDMEEKKNEKENFN